MLQRAIQRRDPDGSRAAVLEAATRVFARHGYAGTTMQAVATEADVKKPLIYHYFGSKEGLYSAVKRSIVGRLPQGRHPTTRISEPPDDSPLEIRRLLDLLRDHELLFRINAWAYLEGDSELWPEVIELVLEVRRRIEGGTARGIIQWDIDLDTLGVMLLSLVSFGPQLRSQIANDRGRGPDLVRLLIALTVEGRVPPP